MGLTDRKENGCRDARLPPRKNTTRCLSVHAMIGVCNWTGSHPAGGTRSSTAGEGKSWHWTKHIPCRRVYPDRIVHSRSSGSLAESSVVGKRVLSSSILRPVRKIRTAGMIDIKCIQSPPSTHWTPQPHVSSAREEDTLCIRRATEMHARPAPTQNTAHM